MMHAIARLYAIVSRYDTTIQGSIGGGTGVYRGVRRGSAPFQHASGPPRPDFTGATCSAGASIKLTLSSTAGDRSAGGAGGFTRTGCRVDVHKLAHEGFAFHFDFYTRSGRDLCTFTTVVQIAVVSVAVAEVASMVAVALVLTCAVLGSDESLNILLFIMLTVSNMPAQHQVLVIVMLVSVVAFAVDSVMRSISAALAVDEALAEVVAVSTVAIVVDLMAATVAGLMVAALASTAAIVVDLMVNAVASMAVTVVVSMAVTVVVSMAATVVVSMAATVVVVEDSMVEIALVVDITEH